ncbi:hypothetical protein MBRA_05097 [Methylobacterium brachiatum]|jgi:hypothetical protein|nr:hypothetical protein MBRA_05097 [Methylobacterium brachiatum]
MDRATIRRVAVRLNAGTVRGSSKALAAAMGVPIKTARAWMLAPTEKNYRPMSRTAKRLFAVIVLLDSTNKLTPEFLEAVAVTERLLEAGELTET